MFTTSIRADLEAMCTNYQTTQAQFHTTFTILSPVTMDHLYQELQRLWHFEQSLTKIIAKSEGVAGWNLNGDIAPWDQFDNLPSIDASANLQHSHQSQLRRDFPLLPSVDHPMLSAIAMDSICDDLQRLWRLEDTMSNIIAASEGVAGYHRDGSIAPWDYFGNGLTD